MTDLKDDNCKEMNKSLMTDLKDLDVSFKEHLNITTDTNGLKWAHYNFDNMSKHLGSWENHVFYTIKKLMSPQDTFVDVGSNIGYHSIRISNLGYKVISIEPNPDIFKLLEFNFKLNGLENFTLFPYGLSKADEKLYTEPLPYSFNLGFLPLSNRGSIYVPTYEYDKLDIKDSVKVIKIDVSGHELNVLYGMIDTFNKQRPYVILPLETEICKKEGYTCEHIVNLFYSLNYKCLEICSDYPCDHLFYPIEKEEEIKEVFNVVNKNYNNSINDNLNLGVNKMFNPLEEKRYEFQLLCNWTSSDELCKIWEKMKPEDSKIVMTTNVDNTEYSVIINSPPPNSLINPSKTMVFRMEPDVEENVIFNNWYKSKKHFMRFFSNNNYRNNSEWHLGKTYKEILNTQFEKTKTFSTILSGLYKMEGHKLRVDFVRYLEDNNVEIDIYGRDNDSCFKNYICPLPYHNKDDAILPYKYTFIAENCDLKNYFTEKIIDPILGETLCFYWGCSDLEKYIDENAFIRLPLENKEESLRIVLEAIKNDEWSKRIECIRREKRKILEYYSFFNRVESYFMMDKYLTIKVLGEFTNEEWVEFSNMAIINDVKNFSRGTEDEVVEKDTLYLPSNYIIRNGFNDYLSVLYRKVRKEYPDFKEFYITKLDSLNLEETETPPEKYIKIVSKYGNKKVRN